MQLASRCKCPKNGSLVDKKNKIRKPSVYVPQNLLPVHSQQITKAFIHRYVQGVA